MSSQPLPCPACGCDGLQHWTRQWISYDEVSLDADGTIDSADPNNEREWDKEVFACADCLAEWPSATALLAAHRAAQAADNPKGAL